MASNNTYHAACSRLCRTLHTYRCEARSAGSYWVYELKHDGYRLMVRKTGVEVRIYSRRGADFTSRFPHLVKAASRLRATSALLDGEGIVYDQKVCRTST